MGISTSNESRFLYKIDSNYKLTQIDNYASFEKTPFEEGAFRYCYKGEIRNINNDFCTNCYFPSGKCVVKVFKKKIAKYSSDLSEDFKNSIYANRMAKIFRSTQMGSQCYDLKFVIPFAASLEKYASYNLFFLIPIRDDDSMQKIKKNEWLAIEPYITGKYEKFVSNTNWTNPSIGEAIPAFMHWNWVYSKGEKVVSDVQGVIKNNYYQLTDPAVQSINQEYGSTDLGAYGILVFLAKHKHNDLCKHLPWPSFHTINMLRSYHKVTNKRTSFSFEFKNDPNIKKFYLNIKKSVFHDDDDDFFY